MARQKRPVNGVSAKFKQLLKARGIPLQKAAATLGVSVSGLCDVSSGRNGISAQLAARLHRIGIDGRALFLEQASDELAYFEAAEKREQGRLALVAQINARELARTA
jgi:transcriptional regulator with XRE-family HTH domain